jgi:hypothetical protein
VSERVPIAIYVLVDPRTKRPRYVGKTSDPGGRLRTHLASSHNIRVASWVGELAEVGAMPEMRILEWVDAEDADSAERRAIGRHRHLKLFNVVGLSDGLVARDWNGARRAPGWLKKRLKEKPTFGP